MHTVILLAGSYQLKQTRRLKKQNINGAKSTNKILMTFANTVLGSHGSEFFTRFHFKCFFLWLLSNLNILLGFNGIEIPTRVGKLTSNLCI